MLIGAIDYADQMLGNPENQIKAVLENFSKRTGTVLDFLTKEGDAIFSEREAWRELVKQQPALMYNDDSNN